jgi:choline dehydrogenase
MSDGGQRAIPRACDTLIVGGGTAGCVLAARLSEDAGQFVVLVEAGPDYGAFAEGRWPADLTNGKWGVASSHDWDYWSLPRPGGAEQWLSIARVIGGCSAHNSCGAMWPPAADYDEWAALVGSKDWDWAHFQRCLQKVESDAEAAGNWHGRTGPVPVTRHLEEPLNPYSQGLIDACQSLGIPWLDDANDPHNVVGVGQSVWNSPNNVRWNSGFAYLDPARERPNLTIVDRSLASRIELEGRRATGVTFQTPGGPATIAADQVVVSCGSYNSPTLLMRSGIGPGQHLRDIGIAPLHDLPGVGEHLVDHPAVPFRFAATAEGGRRYHALVRDGSWVQRSQLKIRLTSSLATSPCDMHILPLSPELVGDGWEATIRAEIYRSRSAGTVRLRSADPTDCPVIDHGFFSDSEERDLAVIFEGAALIRRLVETPEMKDLIAVERWPGSWVEGDALKRHAAANVVSYHHPSGTCKMGPASDPLAVVDPTCRVQGLDNLYVVDLSIVPFLPAALPNLSVMAIAERAAELLG